MPISKINTKSTQINKNINSFQNIDDIIIKPVNSNFIELVEKNLNNNNYKNQINKSTNINLKHEPDSKKIQNIEKNIKREKIKLNKEKAKEIEKNNIHNIIINQNKKEKNKNSKTIPTSKSNNFDKKIKKKVENIDKNKNRKKNNDWSKAKFERLNDDEVDSFQKYETNNPSINQSKNNSNSNNSNINISKKSKNKKDNNKSLDDDNIINYMNKEIEGKEKYNKLLKIYNNELLKLENEKKNLNKLKSDYEHLSAIFQKEKKQYNEQKLEEKKNFDNFIAEEMKLINKEKRQLNIEQKNLNEMKIKYQMKYKIENKKVKNEVDSFKNKMKFQLKHNYLNFLKYNNLRQNI